MTLMFENSLATVTSGIKWENWHYVTENVWNKTQFNQESQGGPFKEAVLTRRPAFDARWVAVP